MLTSTPQTSPPARLERSIPSPKHQVAEFHRPSSSPPQRIILAHKPPSPVLFFVLCPPPPPSGHFNDSLLPLALNTENFFWAEHRRGPCKFKSHPYHLLHSIHSCPKTSKEGQYLLPGVFRCCQSRGSDCQHLFIRARWLWQNSLTLKKSPKTHTGKERPVLDPFPNPHT